jgi:hypothetical protein
MFIRMNDADQGPLPALGPGRPSGSTCPKNARAAGNSAVCRKGSGGALS